MKKFTFLKNTADVLEYFLYLFLFGGIILIIVALTSYTDIPFIAVFGSIIIFVVFWLLFSVGTLITIHVIRLLIVNYQTAYETHQLNKEILTLLQTNKNVEESGDSMEYNLWKRDNPTKSINDFFTEKNNK